MPFGVLVVLLRVAAAAANADDASNATAAAAAASVKMNDGARDICLMTAAATSDAHVRGRGRGLQAASLFRVSLGADQN